MPENGSAPRNVQLWVFKALRTGAFFANGIVLTGILFECAFVVMFVMQLPEGGLRGDGGMILAFPYLMLPFFGVLFILSAEDFRRVHEKGKEIYDLTRLVQLLSLLNFFLATGLLAVNSFILMLILMWLRPLPEMLFGTAFFLLALICSLCIPVMNIGILVLARSESVRSYYIGPRARPSPPAPVPNLPFRQPFCGICHVPLAYIYPYKRWYCPSCKAYF